MIKGENGAWNNYINDRIDIGLFFFFVGCAGISIIVWVFNWICWLNQCCCCDFLHNPINKKIAWWLSFLFLLGILACCIAAVVSINRFGFGLDGIWCSLDRIYYDFKYGQLKESEPKWGGFEEINNILKNLNNFINALPSGVPLEKENNDKYCESTGERCNLIYKKLSESYEFLKNSKDSLEENIAAIKEDFPDNPDAQYDFDKLENKFLKYFHDKGDILHRCMKILAMVYYCLFLITITFAGVSMMFYACLKRQGYLITFMHILWNIIRFFMFSFFIFGAIYGILYLILKDLIVVIHEFFTPSFINDKNNELLPKNSKILLKCINKNDFKFNFVDQISPEIRISLEDFFTNYHEMSKIIEQNKISDENKAIINNLSKEGEGNLNFGNLHEIAVKSGGLFGSFDCGFLEGYLDMVYRTLRDTSKESQYLSALSLCSSFFGAISVYFFLLVLHHYNNELFFDSGKSIFKGFDGFGGGYKKKKIEQDPAYKKRKLRAEIELTSKNEEANNYKDINKNEDEE